MTEAEWLVSDDPLEMLEELREKLSPRRLRLFAAACARRCHEFMTYFPADASRCIDAAEGYADGHPNNLKSARGPDSVLTEYQIRNFPAPWDASAYASAAAGTATYDDAFDAAEGACWLAQFAYDPEAETTPGGFIKKGAELRVQATILRCITGDSFARQKQRLSCPQPLILNIAQAAYDERHLPSGHLDNARLAVLSDALEEAGCTDADILSHLRSPGVHVRGCWALDLVLGKN